MKVSEALDLISRNYVPGVVGFYGKMNPDPWEKAHEDLHQVMVTLNPDAIGAAAEAFASKCLRLIQTYKASQSGRAEFNFADAAQIGDVERVKKLQGSRDKRCYVCHSADGVSLAPDPEDAKRVVVVCKEHKPKKGKP